MATELHREVVAVERSGSFVVEAGEIWPPTHILVLRANARKKQRTSLPGL